MTFYRSAVSIVAGLSFLCCQTLPGQSLLTRKVSFVCYDCTPAEALVRLSHETSVNISFSNELLSHCGKVRIKSARQPLGSIIRDITQCIPVHLHTDQEAVVITRRTLYYTLSGYLTDQLTGERLIGATIMVRGQAHVPVHSNEFGFFSLRLPEGQHWVSFECMGYRGEIQTFHLQGDRDVQIRLKNINRLPEIIVPAESPADGHTTNRQQGVTHESLSKDRLHFLPMPGGESDVLRQAALLGGIQSGVDGLGGLHVRGGNADQNLILLDDVPVYNAGHALGLFSVFNPAITSSTRLWKGGFPARYGGRISSILDIRTRDGDQEQYHAQVTAGTFATGLTVEGPVLRGKSGFLAGVRATYLDPWIQLLSQRDNVLIDRYDNPNYRFFDAHFKIHYTFSEKNRVYFSFYNGGDSFYNSFKQSYTLQSSTVQERIRLDSEWGNTIAAVRWNHVFHDRIFSNTTLRHSRFLYKSNQNFRLEETGKSVTVRSDLAQLYQSFIRDWSVKTDFTWWSRAARNTLRWGAAYSLHDFRPGALSFNLHQADPVTANLDSLATAVINNDQPLADEAELYLESNWQPSPRFGVEAGLHWSFFQSGASVYSLPQPRLVFIHRFDNGWEQWINVQRMGQNLHQVGSYSISLPYELWVPSTARVQPEIARQISVGTRWSNRTWRLQAEVYYKKFDRILTFLSFGNFFSDNFTQDASAWEDRIATGTGQAKGVEILVEKQAGKLTGAVAYTLSKADRYFDEINGGRPFPFRFDRRHDLKIQMVQQLGRKYAIGAVWVWASGNPMTLAAVKYRYESVNNGIDANVNVYSSVNGYRLPALHRLDFTFSARFQKRKRTHVIQAGGYNIYNRANPFYVFINANAAQTGKGKQFTLLPFLPILRYELHL